MSRRTVLQGLRVLEFAYAVIALFALTQGPVIRLWRPSEALLGSLPSPSIQQAHFATYLAAQLPAVVLWARRLNGGWFHERSNQALMVFLTWLGLGVTWSTFARVSVPEYLSLVMTTIFGLYLASSFSLRQFWLVVTSAMALGVGFSWVAIMRLWDAAVNFQENYWVGIYYNRNSLAPVAAVAILGALAVAIQSITAIRPGRNTAAITTVGAVVVLTIFATIELWKSESQTSPAALVIAGATVVVWLVVRRVTRRGAVPSRVESLSTPLVLIIAAVALFAAMRMEIWIGGVDSQTSAFNQRSGLWSLSWAGVLEKPWHGWGWMSAWHTPLFFLASKEPTWMAWDLTWSHNGYHDILLGGGIPAGGLFAFYVLVASRSLDSQVRELAVPRLLVVSFVLAAATQESFLIGTHFLWALLVATLSVGTSGVGSVDEKNSNKSAIRSL